MTVFKPRTRVVYFRISEDEFSQLNHLCQQQGLRSLSDMARGAMQELLGQNSGREMPAGMTSRLDTLERILTDLQDALAALATKWEINGQKEHRSDHVV
jgi:hypothetical protein